MKKISCALLLLILPLSAVFAQRRASGEQPAVISHTPDLDTMEAAVFHLVNAHRATLNLLPLQPDTLLSDLARTHSQNMAAGKVRFDHVGFSDRRKAYKERRGFVGLFGENIAEGAQSAEGVLDMWLNSEGHRKNIEGPFQYLGVGIARTKEGLLYFTQLFASGK